MEWVQRVLKDHRAMEWNDWVGLERSLMITEPQNHIMVVLGGSLKIIEPWSVWIGLERSLKITEPQNDRIVWIRRVLEGHRTVWIGRDL